ncbi:hypothetical protein ACFX13_003616 [Malus domestica]|uniref:Uncharacterized protein n=1 Tax=Malus domestica TaxID=3750 RepID=A0A498J2L7_MALDO|nr:uncharacterized protein LOC126585971 isoform X1 [Malus sylvestris]XP_050106562.1 uncharacterized protein LOC126585971 isoform X1 [Malus sylvestris]XP_050106563.1 uncharacterized protein LOC126585971 isoform X1 [Malus sylvestris]XP_050106564.1 uncharacterized protein LOC126585971 isoform X1 [Malus sylvestris]RXH87681.1 hypothetical protein DVH24_034581 [Malus domestica]
MAAASQSVASCCSGLVHRSSHAKLPFGIKQCNGAKINNCNDVLVTSRWIVRGGRGIQFLTAHRVGAICAASVGRDHRQLRIDDDSPQEPYFLSLVKEAVRGLRSLFVFLVEQPSQLKYIEWPGFRSTLKTATFTLVLVALLIVALSSTDSALSYLLALILRRTP